MQSTSMTYTAHGAIHQSRERRSARVVARETELFATALRANSNLSLDWLWLYMQLSDSGAKQYCLERALDINPLDQFIHDELARLKVEGALR